MRQNDRIVVDPRILAGKPVIRGTRIPVYLILDMLGAGADIDEILRQYPQLSRDDVLAAISYASRVIEGTEWYEYGVV